MKEPMSDSYLRSTSHQVLDAFQCMEAAKHKKETPSVILDQNNRVISEELGEKISQAMRLSEGDGGWFQSRPFQPSQIILAMRLIITEN